MKKLLLILSLVTLVNCTKEKIVNVEKIVTKEVIVTNEYNLIAIAGEGGAITKSAASGSSVTLSASAYVGYEFEAWSSGSTDNPLTLNIGSDQTITANFGKLIELEGVGTLSEQTTKEAIKTIYGKWDLSSSSKRNSCNFISIEFLNQKFFLTLNNFGDVNTYSGKFTVSEDASGKVDKIELEDLATITNMVVEKVGDALNASFNIVLSLPDEVSNCLALSGDVSAVKEKPMAESLDPSSNPNHSKFVGSWEFTSITVSGKPEVSIQDEYQIVCEDDPDPNCTPASSVNLVISAFGTWVITFLDSNGYVIDDELELGTWEWTNSSQTQFKALDFDYEQSGDEEDPIDIVSLTSTDITFSFTDEEDGEIAVTTITAKKLSN